VGLSARPRSLRADVPGRRQVAETVSQLGGRPDPADLAAGAVPGTTDPFEERVGPRSPHVETRETVEGTGRGVR